MIISEEMLKKLNSKHQVTRVDVQQCFTNKCGPNLEDTRENNKTDPPTLWFIAPTNKGELMKIIFVYRDGKIFLKSAYKADEISIRIYDNAR